MLQSFLNDHACWVIEDTYGSLIEAAISSCTELRFLTRGIDACIRNYRARPQEQDTYASPKEQEARVALLIKWARHYETRNDDYGLHTHRALLDGFPGPQNEYIEPLQ